MMRWVAIVFLAAFIGFAVANVSFYIGWAHFCPSNHLQWAEVK